MVELDSRARSDRALHTSASDPSCEKVEAKIGSMYFGYVDERQITEMRGQQAIARP